jgi:hypothetical protein
VRKPHCAGDDPPCLGAELHPSPPSSPTQQGCSIAVQVPESEGFYVGGVQLEVRAECTDAVKRPCNFVPAPAPTLDDPVTATWEEGLVIQTREPSTTSSPTTEPPTTEPPTTEPPTTEPPTTSAR